MRLPIRLPVGALALALLAFPSAAQPPVPSKPPAAPATPPGQPAPTTTDSTRRTGGIPAVPTRPDTVGRTRTSGDSVPLPLPPGATPPPVVPTQRDTSAAARAGAAVPAVVDTTRRPTPPRGDSTARDSTFDPFRDLNLKFRGSLESKLERTRNERCSAIFAVALSQGCRSSFQPDFAFQFGISSDGSLADRLHVTLDYDSQREFDASNVIALSYQSTKPAAGLSRVEVGNVTFAPPASRFITGGIPSNNYGLQALGAIGPMRWRAIAAQQRGTVQRDRVFTVGERATQAVERPLEDFEIEPRRFFWTIDPRLLPGYPNVDILDRVQMARLAASLPDTLRPARLVLYRQLVGATFQNPRGPRPSVRGARNPAPQTYEVLREGVDYYVDPSQLWIALVRPLGLNTERLAVAYEANVAGRRTRVDAGGTPDLEYTGSPQFANLVWEPELAPGDPAFARELRNVYRLGGEDLRRETVGVRVVAGAGDQEKPADASLGATYLQLFGLAQRSSATTFDVENRLWPRPQDPNVGAGGGTLGGKLLRDYFIVFPSLQPFARAGGVRNTANPSNDTLYTYPSEFLYSTQRPPAIYRLLVRYESEGGPEASSIALGSLQLRPGSERLTALGRPLVRGVDYAIDYELGTVTFLDPAGLFPTPTQVTVQFEENPVFVSQPTNVFGATAEFPTSAGTVFVTAIAQSQKQAGFNRPPLGFEASGSALAGVGAQLSWDAPLLARAAASLTRWSRAPRAAGDTTAAPGARITFRGEIAASKPRPNRNQQAYLETFEGQGRLSLSSSDAEWYFASRPPVGSLGARFGTFDDAHAATLAWQGNVTARGANGRPFAGYTITDIDSAAKVTGAGFLGAEPTLWLTMYPLRIGGLPAATSDTGAAAFRWTIGNAPTSGRRWRSIRTVLNPSGADLSRVEDLEFYALVYGPDDASLRRNPTLVFDFGDISENSVAFRPESLQVVRRAGGTAVDSLYRGKRLAGPNRLDTERDTLSRVFNAVTNDVGLPGDRPDTLVVTDATANGVPVRRDSVPICRAVYGGVRVLGDPTANCTVQNGRLDEEDIDQDGFLNTAVQGNDERIKRFVIDLSDRRTFARTTNCNVAAPPGLGDLTPGATAAATPRCWVLVRVPFRAATDSSGAFNPRRVRAARLTMISGAGEGAESATTIALTRLQLTGSPWLRRSDRVGTGVGGDSTGTTSSFVVAGTIGTQDSTRDTPYTPPPGVVQTTDQLRSGQEANQVQVNERSLRLRAGVPGGELAPFERAEAYFRFPEGAKNVMSYRELRIWARGNGHGWGDDGDLQFFVKLGRDEHNFYLYRTPIHAGADVSAWLPEVRVDFERFYRLRAALQESLLPGSATSGAASRFPCSDVDAELVRRSGLPRGLPVRRAAACDGGYMVYTVDGTVTPPNLAAVQELAVGFVRVSAAHRGATPIVPNDTLELWVDDVRLADARAELGMAGELAVGVQLGDLADFRVNLSRRDPQFRQLGEAPSFVTTGGVEIGGSVRLDRLLPRALGLALPLTITHTSLDASPEFIQGTDLEGDALGGLRAPRASTTSLALTVRRTTPSGGALAPLLDHLALTSSYVSASTRSAYQDASRHAFSLRADYDLAPAARTIAALGGLRWSPTALRLTSHLARTGDRQLAFLAPTVSPFDTGRVARGLDHVWQHGATIELQPLQSVTARWNASTLRDLRDYPTLGDSSGPSLRSGPMGFERERVMNGELRWAAPLTAWLRPRADVTTTYGMTRDPNTPTLLGDATLPRRIGATEVLAGGTSLDLARVLYGGRAVADTAHRPWLARALQPLDLTASRTLSSSFDATAADPGLAYQLGLAGIGGLRAIGGRAATLAGVVDGVSLRHSLMLPYGFVLTNHLETGATRSWWRRSTTGALAEGTGDLRTVPDLTLRWTWKPTWAAAVVSNIGGSAGLVRRWQTAFAPADSMGPADERATLNQDWPLSGTVTWSALGGLTTSGGLDLRHVTDDVPGSRRRTTTRESNAEASRAFTPPDRWGLKSAIRTRVGWSESRTRALVDGRSLLPGEVTAGDLFDPFRRIVQADAGRRALTFGANSDVAENVTLSVTGSQVTTFNENFGTRIRQTLFSAVLQLNFFGEGMH